MKMVGAQDESLYRGYAIADEAMLKEAGEKLERLYSADERFKVGREVEKPQ